MRPAVALVFIVLASAGHATAAGAPFELQLDHVHKVGSTGTATITTHDGVVNVTASVADGLRIRGHASRADGWVATSQHLWTPVDDHQMATPQRDPISIDGPELGQMECGTGGCVIAWLIQGEGATGRVDRRGELLMTQLLTPSSYCGFKCGDGSIPFATLPAGSYHLSSLADTLHIQGSVVLLVRDATLHLRDRDGADHVIDAQSTLGEGTAPRFATYRYAVIHFDNASFDCDACEATLESKAIDLQARGTFTGLDARGTVKYAGRSVPFDHADLAIDGDAAFELEELSLSPELDTQGDSQGAAHGTATAIHVGPELLTAPRETHTAAVVTGAGALLLLFLVVIRFLPGLYSRIGPDSVLANPNRAHIHRLIVERPGSTTSTLAREAGVARVVAQHHLRILEGQALVRSQRVGVEVRYFTPEAFPAGGTPAHPALAHPLRNDIGAAIRSSPGLTQSDLTRQLGVSQRLASYHLQKLNRAGLVRVEGENPQRYHPDGPLTAAGDDRPQ